MNPYLTKKREQAEAVRASIEGLQTRAADENRDLSEEELRVDRGAVQDLQDHGRRVETLTDVETRSQKVNELAAKMFNGQKVDPPAGGDGEKTRTSTTTATDRDPGHYRKDAGRFSYFGDLYRSRMGDEDASTRLHERTGR